MKKTILLIISFIFFFESFSQSSFGIKAGTGISNTPHKGLDYKMRPSLTAGIYFQHELNKFYLQPELIWSLKGYRYTSSASKKELVSFHYLNLPLIIGIMAGENFSVEAGPEFGYLLNSSDSRSDHNTKKFDIAAAVGFASRLNDKISIGVRYAQGLIKADQLVIVGIPPYTQSEKKALGRNQAVFANLLIALN